MKTACLLVTLLLAGCSVRTFYNSQGVPVYRHSSLGTRQNIGDLTGTISSNTITIKLRGYSSDQVEALGVVAEKTAEGVARGLRP